MAIICIITINTIGDIYLPNSVNISVKRIGIDRQIGNNIQVCLVTSTCTVCLKSLGSGFLLYLVGVIRISAILSDGKQIKIMSRTSTYHKNSTNKQGVPHARRLSPAHILREGVKGLWGREDGQEKSSVKLVVDVGARVKDNAKWWKR